MTEITIGGATGAALLGPLAVDPAHRANGVGTQLMTQALEAARSSGTALVVLVGDEPYYGRFGFKPVPFGQIVFPGPVNPARILACELKGWRVRLLSRSRRRRTVESEVKSID